MMRMPKNIGGYVCIDPNSPSGLTWVTKPSRTIVVGRPAFASRGKYFAGTLFGVQFYAHRVVFYLANGYLPQSVDHIDGNRYNNHPNNLRAVTQSENMQNTIGRGTYPVDSKSGRWCAKVVLNGKQHYLGTFDTEDMAHAAYLTAKRKLHPTAPGRCYAR